MTPYRFGLVENQLLLEVKNRRLFGYVRCHIEIHPFLNSIFQVFFHHSNHLSYSEKFSKANVTVSRGKLQVSSYNMEYS